MLHSKIFSQLSEILWLKCLLADEWSQTLDRTLYVSEDVVFAL